MPPRRRIQDESGQGALAAWVASSTGRPAPRALVATAVRYTLEELATRHPGRSVEVRVPPFGAVQCVEGPVHRRGTPPNTVETDAETWLGLALGHLTWAEAEARGVLRWSGIRAGIAELLPLWDAPPTPAADGYSPG